MSLIITAEALGGSDIADCARDAIRIANKLGSTVMFDFNGVSCMACPGDSAEKLADAYLSIIDERSKPHPKRIARGYA